MFHFIRKSGSNSSQCGFLQVRSLPLYTRSLNSTLATTNGTTVCGVDIPSSLQSCAPTAQHFTLGLNGLNAVSNHNTSSCSTSHGHLFRPIRRHPRSTLNAVCTMLFVIKISHLHPTCRPLNRDSRSQRCSHFQRRLYRARRDPHSG